MKQLLIRLKIILQFNLFYVVLSFITFFFVVFSIAFRIDKSVYVGDETNFILEVDEYKFDGNKLSLELSGKEKIVGNYYIESYEELLYLKDNIRYGIKLDIIGILNIPSNNTIPNTFNYKEYLSNNDIYYILDIDDIKILDCEIGVIDSIRNSIKTRINSIDNTGYMNAFILGNKDDIDSKIYSNYQKIGITHLFALSGMHIGLLSGIVLRFIKRLREGKKYLIISAVLVIYGFIVGYPSSIKRCILFFIINSLNKYYKLDVTSFKVLLIVVCCLIFNNYKIIYDVGFVYSVVTVGGIILCNSFINCDNKLISSFKLSLVAFLFSLPISLCNFYEVNLLSVFYNIIFVPYVSIVVYPLCLMSFVFPFLYDIFVFFINLLEILSKFLSSFNYFNIYLNLNIIQIIIFYFVTIVMFCKNEFKMFLILIFIIVLDILSPYFDSNAYVYFFNVGQGDSSLIIEPNRNEVILIDTGGLISYTKEGWMKKDEYYVSDNVISFMKSIGIRTITKMILTHGDQDHIGEVEIYLDEFKINQVIFNCGEFNNLENNLVDILKQRNISYSSCDYTLNNNIYNNENDNSIVVYKELYNYKFLFMGDASIEVEHDLMNKYNLRNIDVLKVGHHGSKTSSSDEFVKILNPRYSIISVGKNNRYGHPNDGVLENLIDSKIYRTDQDGSIMFIVENNRMNIETCPP